ncbi:MAG: ferrochelatase, partial [Novosphingobium sp.]|nr:ferrochelatase [Novosphingobium sp.]
VVEIPKIFWQPILRGLVLRTRPRKSAHAYSQVWTEDGSPLAFHTAAQARALQARFNAGGLGDTVIVRYAMRYQKPAMAVELDKLLAEGCERILVAPLYPQYSGATTASALDAVANWIKDRRRLPALRTLPPYFDDPLAITAMHRDLCAQIAALGFAPELLVLSFHGMPERTLRLGDPYHCHCQKTARLLSEAFAVSHPQLKLATSFQSRFGRAKWLEPATDDVIKVQGANGIRRMVVAAPGFSSDCLETIEELGIRGREDFEAAGGTHFAALTCLNTGAPGMDMLEALIRRELAGWI